MPTTDDDSPEPVWFRHLLDTADDVYFRYNLWPNRGFAYLSPSVRALTGHEPAAFIQNPALCLALLAREDRRVLRQLLRARRGVTATVRILHDGMPVHTSLRSVAVVRDRRVVAVEGVARATRAPLVAPAAIATDGEPPEGPTPQRLAALMYEVHALLHQVLPPQERQHPLPPAVIGVGDLTLDLDRLVVTEGGKMVTLTSREVMVLRYLLTRPGRVVTRAQLLTDVWGYHYTGDDRTIDVHVSRLRRKLPSLAARLVAVKHLGYRLEPDEATSARSTAS